MRETEMNVLVVGGSGVIGAGIVKHLMARGARVTTFDRGRSMSTAPPGVRHLVGDRTDAGAFQRAFEKSRYDVVIDMLCFDASDAESAVRAFAGRCEQLMLCSTVCTYGVKVPSDVLVDESFPQEPVSTYGRNKLACERHLERAAERGGFKLTIVRPSHTYGPGSPLIDQLEFDGVAWDRVVRGLPILCAGDGLGLWQSTHRDDCGKFFAHAALNPKTYGGAYNAVREEVLTWREYYRRAARALDVPAHLVFAPAGWLLRRHPTRFRLLGEITRFHGAYSAAKARVDVPEFRATIDFEVGAREAFADMRRRRAWRDSTLDEDYQLLVDKAVELGFEVVTA